MLDVWVAGAGMTRIGRRSESLPDLMAEAAHAALRGAGLERPDAIVVAAMNPEEFVGDGNFASYVATHMGFAETPAIRIETATSSGAAAFYAGFAQIAAGLRRAVLVVGGEKMTHLDTPRVSELIGRSIDPYERSYGATMPALAGLVARALMAGHGVAPRELAQVAVKNHANALRNPYAHFRRAVTIDEVLDSRMVADPLRLLHCCPISDGAAAVVLTAAHAGVRVAGIGQGTDTLAIRHRDVLTSFRATRAAALAAFAMAGFGPERVDVAELHDAFTPFELISLEDLGLVPAGKAGRATLDGDGARADRRVRVAAHGARRGVASGGAHCARSVDRRARDEQLGDPAGGGVIEPIQGSRCPACGLTVAPPTPFCPRDPVEMTPVELEGAGEIVSFTTLHSPPAGFRSSLHIALVALEGGARFICHGAETRGLRIGSRVAIEAVDDVYYFSHLGALDRARLFWRRAGRAGDRMHAITRSLAKRVWKGKERVSS